MISKNSISTLAPPDPAGLISLERRHQFDSIKMHRFIEGLKEKSEQILLLYQSLERDPVLRASFRDYDLSRAEHRVQTAERIARMAQYLEQESLDEFMRRLNLITVYDPSLGIRISVNLGLFANCIQGNGTASQSDYWLNTKQLVQLKQIWGCFAMTELAHGSNVAGCETRAEFDPERDEFVVSTPHVGATKWWIGGAAHLATHASVYARLVVGGKDYGVKTFVVPLRDSNHNLMPGVAIGDIGGKMGRHGVDNGWIQFLGVRIPRFFMLQKYCQVLRQGEVKLPPLEQLSYISLLGGRVMMATDSYRMMARFCTVAVRYGVGRRQFRAAKPAQLHETDQMYSGDASHSLSHGSSATAAGSSSRPPAHAPSRHVSHESQLLDYPLHQRRVLPFVALAYALALGTNRLEQQHRTVVTDLDRAVSAQDNGAISAGIAATKSLFVDLALLKLTLTWLAADCINETRQACGGQGYSAYSGFGKAFDDWVVQCTWEGDNNVLGMSAGRTVMKAVESLGAGGRKPGGTLAFLGRAVGADDSSDAGKGFAAGAALLRTSADLEDAALVLRAIESLIVRVAVRALDAVQLSAGDWDAVSYDRVLISKLRCHHYLLQAFIENLATVDQSLFPYVESLAKLYYLCLVVEAFGAEFVAYGVMDPSLKLAVSTREIPAQCAAVRPHAVALTDAFQQPDSLLSSAIGNYNGDIYENYFDVVKAVNPPYKSKAPYSAELEAMLNRSSVAERERNEKSDEVAAVLEK